MAPSASYKPSLPWQRPKQELREEGKQLFHHRSLADIPLQIFGQCWIILPPLCRDLAERTGIPSTGWLEHDPSLGLSVLLFQ